MKVKQHYANGDFYDGEVNDKGEAEGYGECTYNDGSSYSGEFRNNTWHGLGTFYTSDGWRFEGRFKDGYFDDFFRIVSPDKTVIMGKFIQGYLSNGKVYGMQKASIHYPDGVSYEGEVNSSLQEHGSGKITTAYGFVIEGRFANGAPCGMVTIHEPEDTTILRGKMDGKYLLGTWNIEWPKDGIHMTADFENGYMDSNGDLYGIQTATITYKNGDVYTGRVDPQLRFSGYGTLRRADGVIDAGIWEYGMLKTKDLSKSRSYTDTLHQAGQPASKSKTSTAVWTILENSSYHCLLVYSGDDIHASPLYRIDTNEINKVFAGSQPYTFVRDYKSGDIAYTVVRDAAYNVLHVRVGNNPFMGFSADVRYTIKGEWIAIGEDNLMNHITYRIRDLGYKKTVEYY